MCRMLVVRGRVQLAEVVAAAKAMSVGLTADHERREDDGRPWDHLDGWGLVAQDEQGQWRCARGAAAISDAASSAVAPLAETDLAVIHLRKASDPQYLGIQYAHPVQVTRAGRACYFFHNGYAPDVGGMIGKPEGWDSERLLEYLLPVLGSAAPGDDEPLRRRMEALPDSTTSANFIFVEGDEVTVCNWYPPTTESPRYYALRAVQSAGRLVIASDPVPELAFGAAFRPCGNHTIARFTRETPAQAVLEALGARLPSGPAEVGVGAV